MDQSNRRGRFSGARYVVYYSNDSATTTTAKLYKSKDKDTKLEKIHYKLNKSIEIQMLVDTTYEKLSTCLNYISSSICKSIKNHC